MKFIKFYLSALFLFTLVISGCDTTENVARVGDLVVTKQELLREFQKNLGRRADYKDVPISRKEEILNLLIDNKRKLLSAKAQGLDQDSTFLAEVESYRERLIGSRYYEKFIIDQLISSDEVERYIENQAEELNADHILIAFKEVNPRIQRSRAEAEKLAQQVLEMLRNGSDLNLLADEYSDEPGVKKSHGALGWFTWGAMVEPFQQAAWKMAAGEISDPVETRFGFHIIRLNDRREKAGYVRPETDEQIFRVKQTLSKTRADSARALWERYRLSLEKKYNLRLNDENIKKISELITERMNQGTLHTSNFSQTENQTELAQWDGGAISIGSLLARNKNNAMRLLINYKQVKFLENDVRNNSTVELVIHDALKYGIDKDPFVTDLLTVFYDDKLIKLADRVIVQEPATVTNEDAEEYYRENPDKFMRPEELEIWEIFVKDRKQADDIVAQLKRGARFGTLVKKYSQDKMLTDAEGYIGYRSESARGTVSRDAFVTGPGGKIGGPVNYRNGWVVYKTGKLRNKSVRDFKDIQSQAKSILRRERISKNSVQWKNELIEKYPAEIDKVLIESL